MNNKVTRLPFGGKAHNSEVIEINRPITRKPVSIETVFVKVVRERIARDWRRGVMTRDLAARYGVARPEIERIVHEELFSERGAA